MGGPSGRSGSDGWFLEGVGSDPAGDRDASIHESFHHRLDRSTTFGAVMVAYAGLVDAGVGSRERLAQLRDTCRTVHESAATYLTSLSLGRLDDRSGLSPHYRRYHAGMDSLVGGEGTPAWLRFHVALGAARACLQPDVMSVIRTFGLDGIAASSFRSTSLADERFRRLRANPPDVGAIDATAAAEAGLEPDDPRRTGGELQAAWFDPDQQHVYGAYEAAVWREVGARLATEGCEVDEIDAQLAVSRDLLEQGRALGAVYGIVADGTDRVGAERVWSALAPLDSESISLPFRRRAHQLNIDHIENWAVLSAGIGHDEHLHLSIRPTSNYRHFDWDTEPPAGPVCLRRTLETPTGRSIEHTDITTTDPARLAEEWPGTVITTVAESMLTDPRVTPWISHIGDERILLCDTPLIPRLQFWAARQWPFRYMFLSLRAADGGSPMMIAQFTTGDDTPSSPIARPMTPQVVNTIRQALAELDPTNRWSSEDNTLVDDLPGVGVAMFHIIGEDRVFGITPVGER